MCYNMRNAVEMRKVKENIEMGDKKSNAKGVSPHLFLTNVCHSVGCTFEVGNGKVEIGEGRINNEIRNADK